MLFIIYMLLGSITFVGLDMCFPYLDEDVKLYYKKNPKFKWVVLFFSGLLWPLTWIFNIIYYFILIIKG